MLALLILLTGCAPGLRFPGPLGSVGAEPIDPLVVELLPPPPATGAPAAVADADADEEESVRERKPSPLGEAIAAAAVRNLEHFPAGARNDCSGFVSASLQAAGVDVSGNTRSLWELARSENLTHKRKKPRLGDLAFFDNTYDRDRNGRTDDELTHVGIVTEIEDNGTIVLAHGGTSKGRTVLRMNLQHPDVHRDEDGRILNDYLRRERSSDPKGTKHLAGELWKGFATWEEDAVSEGM